MKTDHFAKMFEDTLDSRFFSARVPMDDVSRGRAPACTDGCPQCGTAYVRPLRLNDDGKNGVLAEYRHRACGFRWRTAWAKDEPGVGIHGAAEPSHIGAMLRAIVAAAGSRRRGH